MTTLDSSTYLWKLLDQARGGDDKSLYQLMEEVADFALKRAKHICRKFYPALDDKNDSGDIADTAIGKLFPVGSTKGVFAVRKASSLLAFVDRVVRNEAANVLRERKAFKQRFESLEGPVGGRENSSALIDTIEDKSVPPPSEGTLEDIEASRKRKLLHEKAILRDAMLQLRPDERMAIFYRYLYHPTKNLTLKEVAKLMDTTEHLVTDWIYRGLVKLQRILKDIDVFDVE